ncbi:MAG TPA: hypothetical protein VFA48_02480 [Gammaproteobacteria bacterium]|nr:hypothetical protein [Gammaproteobacteria bacterium]
MADTQNLVLEHLKAIQAALADARERDEELLARMASLESAMLSVKREMLHGDEVDARQQVSLDSIVRRLERIERRLEITD